MSDSTRPVDADLIEPQQGDPEPKLETHDASGCLVEVSGVSEEESPANETSQLETPESIAHESDGILLPNEDSVVEAESIDPGVNELLARAEKMHVELSERLQSLEAVANQLTSDSAERAEHRENREALYEKLAASTTNFHFQLLRPLLSRISMLYDLVGDLGDSAFHDEQTAREAFQIIKNNLREVMELNGVETVTPKTGDAFDCRFHHIVTTEDTSDPTKHEVISRTVADGFIYFGQNERTAALRPSVIRPARVITWRCDSALATTPNETN